MEKLIMNFISLDIVEFIPEPKNARLLVRIRNKSPQDFGFYIEDVNFIIDHKKRLDEKIFTSNSFASYVPLKSGHTESLHVGQNVWERKLSNIELSNSPLVEVEVKFLNGFRLRSDVFSLDSILEDFKNNPKYPK